MSPYPNRSSSDRGSRNQSDNNSNNRNDNYSEGRQGGGDRGRGGRSGGDNRGGFGHRSGGRGGSRGGRIFGKSIDPAVYHQPIDINQEATDIKEKIDSNLLFSDFDIADGIKKVIQDRGFTNPTPIQHQIIPLLLEGKDVVGLSQTGSGKTGSFLIPLIHRAISKEERHEFQSLIIAPTRELAYQIEKELTLFESRRFGLFSVVCVGGMPMGPQIRELRKKNQFVIGTPGRLIDLAQQGYLNLKGVKSIVLDEMDRMLDMGFIEDIEWIVNQCTDPSKQMLFFSATLKKSLLPKINKMSPDATHVSISEQKPSVRVDQRIEYVPRDSTKMQVLSDLILAEENIKALVFVNTKSEAERVAENLYDQGVLADFLHGGKSQRDRIKTLSQYKRLQTGVLVATDVAARGIDIDNITHVFNYDEPDSVESYIHRIGRTGRADKYGKAITLLK